MKQLQHLLSKGLQAMAPLWPPLERAYGFVHQAAHILANPEQDTGQRVCERYRVHLAQMRDEITMLGPLESAFDHFCHITENFGAGLFHCYDVEGLPRTNNELEHCFGVARVHERRATGRRGAIPGVVVRGSVRVLAAVVTKQQVFTAEELRPRDDLRWRNLRKQLQQREDSRRQQWRFRKDPAAYLEALEARLLQCSLPFSFFLRRQSLVSCQATSSVSRNTKGCVSLAHDHDEWSFRQSRWRLI